MQKVLGNLKRGLFFIISAPAGTGKTTLVRMLEKEFSCIYESVSFTTRPPRADETEGRDYHFVSTEEFQKMVAANDFLEFAHVFNHFYGTSKSLVEKERNQGKHVIMVIDTQGAIQLMEKIDVISIFIHPPSIQELRRRLEDRKADSEESVERRLSWAEKEISMAGRYDYQIVNDQLKPAYEILRSILIAEDHRTKSLEQK